jgi:hypothetical protein
LLKPVSYRYDDTGVVVLKVLLSGRVGKIGARMGRKRVWSDAATEKSDTRILEVLIDLDENVRLVVGLRVDVMLEPAGQIANQATGRAG